MIHDINIAIYADDNTPFVSGGTPLNVFRKCGWNTFWMVYQQSHRSKPWQMLSAYEHTYTNFHKLKGYIIKNSYNQKLLGVTVDANLNFNFHL